MGLTQAHQALQLPRLRAGERRAGRAGGSRQRQRKEAAAGLQRGCAAAVALQRRRVRQPGPCQLDPSPP
jgi:hypothetical protein